jgi:hypothetical protein
VELRQTISRMLHTSPNSRPTAQSLIRTPYLQRVLRESLAIKRLTHARLSAIVAAGVGNR